jgi:hypothetical protein
MFTVVQRELVRDTLVARARADERIVAAAAIGASASEGDRWSDLDLTFGVAGGTPIQAVLADWTDFIAGEFDAAVLFDLPFRSVIYRVFLLPGKLQVDLSFAPAEDFGALGPRFHLLFGEAVEHPQTPPPPLQQLFGLAVHHAVRAHICIQRARLWQAEYWVHSLRDEGLALACRRRGLESSHGRGLDRLPPDVLAMWEGALTRMVSPPELQRALAVALNALLRDADDVLPVTDWLRGELQELGQDAEKKSDAGSEIP